MATFLVKTEPGTYSYDDLVRDRKTVWSGVSNPAALGHIRSVKQGDEALMYHTGNQTAIVGLARIVSNPYQDPARPGVNAAGAPKFAVFDLAPLKKAKTPVTLAAIKADARFKDFALVRQGRLSVMPVPPEMDKAIRNLAGL